MLAQQNLLFYPSSVSLNDFSPQIRGSSGWWLQFRAKFPGISTSGIPREWISPMRIAEVIIQHRIVCPLSQQEFPSHGLHIPACAHSPRYRDDCTSGLMCRRISDPPWWSCTCRSSKGS
ncbi:uncharacterized protein LOC135163596 isoform X2 [Diachasmimorpha longicaudata]|uniref:uncharacterized protein LOC135163596 isoform X2 n=1 Tax=Diachasmimorpha longicaudata TaxID=58733 RepID=UPI0030B8A64B